MSESPPERQEGTALEQCDHCGTVDQPDQLADHNCPATCPNGDPRCPGPDGDELPCFPCYLGTSRTNDDDDQADDSVTVHHQARFTDAGEVSIEGEVTDTSLGDFGAEIDVREQETRLEQPQASEFGVDDRPCVQRQSAGEQAALFVDVDETQQTLTGKSATGQCRFTEGDR